MGFLSNILGRSNDPRKETAKKISDELNSYGIIVDDDQVFDMIKRTDEYNKKNNIVSFVSDFEKVARIIVIATDKLPKPMEDYAQEICSTFCEGYNMNTDEPKLRSIGEKMNDNHKQMLVAFRAEELCKMENQKGNSNAGDFTIRYLEYAWDGLGGWRS